MNGNRVLFTLTLLGASLALANLSGPAQATLVDYNLTVGLWHMESIVGQGAAGAYIADDNSSGRTAHNLVLGDSAGNNQPSLTSSATGFGSALLFDGVDDFSRAPGTWNSANNRIQIRFKVKPDTTWGGGDGYAGLVGVGPAQVYLRSNGIIEADVFANNGGSSRILQNGTNVLTDTWHDVSLIVTATADSQGHDIFLTVDGNTLPATTVGALSSNSGMNGDVAVGAMWFSPAYRQFKGAIDEVKVSVPEPSALFMVGLVGLAFVRRRRKA